MNQESNSSSSSRGGNSRNSKNRNRRRRGGNNRKNASNPQGASSATSSRSGNRTNRNRNKSKNSTTTVKYLNLLDQHLQMRRKFYEKFDRVPLQERKSLEKKFFNTVEQLRQFEEKLSDQQRQELHKLTEGYPLDITYSKNHELPPEKPDVEIKGDFEDPHINLTQMERPSYQDDTELTEGSIEDYQKYKGQV